MVKVSVSMYITLKTQLARVPTNSIICIILELRNNGKITQIPNAIVIIFFMVQIL